MIETSILEELESQDGRGVKRRIRVYNDLIDRITIEGALLSKEEAWRLRRIKCNLRETAKRCKNSGTIKIKNLKCPGKNI